ncbi:MAG: ABC transporter transmembrane domain-containing protein, partial [Catalinimonas sp.]
MAKRQADLSDEDKKVRINRESLGHLRQIFGFLRPYRLRFAAGMVLLVFSSLTAMVFPFVTGKLVDAAVLTDPTSRLGDRDRVALLLLVILLVQGVFSYGRIQLFAQVTERALRDVRLQLYTRMMSLGMPFFEQHRVGELNSRLTNDVTQLQSTLSTTLAELFRQVSILIVGIAIIAFKSPSLTGVMLATFPVLVVGAIGFGRYIRRLSKRVQDDLAAANTVAEETLQAVQVVKSFTNERWEIARYGGALQRVVRNALHAARFRGLFASFVIFAIFGGIVLVLWWGLGLVAEGALTIGDLVAFVVYT